MLKQSTALAGLILSLGLTGPALAQDDQTTSEDGATEAQADATTDETMDLSADTVIASVDGVEITLGQMIIARSQLPQQYQQLPPDVLFDGVLTQLIQQQALSATMEEEPARVRIALENQRRSLMAGEALTSFLDSAVSEDAVRAAYDESFAESGGALEYNASHILVPTQEEAADVISRLEGGEEFATLATELSQDPGSGQNGGNLGWFGAGMMVEPFQAAVETLEVGEVSGPVESQFGWHVIQLNETREQTPPAYEEIAGEIEAQLQEEAINSYLTELTESAEVDRPEPGTYPADVLNDLTLLDE
ncbi:peptidylprolyl isomerase [Pseudoroseicyclus tamaricis]|uniref:Parvulin-like PPIase n=1 Tax=Pseudoroseicyclus tamaricis TaxID=2705421 RepID=A0A6B2JW16_9RHOB|nr:peptidylprolyl isomerase [Pseudoroseicyclus tamaricis]NDV02687.1 peptidylprolyl isomerase [Pseudoroseicyclus tamaricis]